jgi:hypothetical protein
VKEIPVETVVASDKNCIESEPSAAHDVNDTGAVSDVLALDKTEPGIVVVTAVPL